jgi:transcriptional regulator GlxA family with amidase domain
MDQRVQLIIAIMREDFHRNLSLQKLAQTINISQSRFHYLFKAETGMTPAHFLHSLRMERARELCETTPMSIKQIMHSVGITDRSHFDRDFKSLYSLTPAQYRATLRLVATIKEA